MANSKYEYVRAFEQSDNILPNTWIVVRLDGRGFHKFSARYNFEKPNDKRALDLMNRAAEAVMKDLADIVIAYGDSDEFSFVFHRSCTLFERRSSKLVSTVVSTFTAYYVHLWPSYFGDSPLTPPLPTFDGRSVCYPTVKNLRDYLSWRQVDCHINNLYNTSFWSLVLKGGLTTSEAEKRLLGTVSSDKNEILFSQFGVNYNNEAEMFKKGSVLCRDYERVTPSGEPFYEDDVKDIELSKSAAEKQRKSKRKCGIAIEHVDIIQDKYWEARPWIISGTGGKLKRDTQPSTHETM